MFNIHTQNDDLTRLVDLKIMRLPDFIIIGASKCGTTTLYEYLCRHPQIYMSTPKELEFFASKNDENDANYAKGIDWYASQFSSAESHQVCGEASGTYTHWPQTPNAAARIAQVIPKVKLIYIMRHPVDRTYSHYRQEIKYNQITKRQMKVLETFEENLKRETWLLETSNYMQHIEQYLRFFSRESFLFLFMEELGQKPAETLRNVCHFLEIDEEIDLIQDNPISANVGRHFTEGWFFKARMIAPLKSIPGVARMAALLPKSVRQGVYQGLKKLPYYEKWVKKRYIPPAMQPETRQQLLKWFEEPNEKLAEFLQCDLSAWSK